MTDHIHDILLRDNESCTLAPLYIIRRQNHLSTDSQTFPEEWVQGLITKILSREFNLSFKEAAHRAELGHSDILLVKKKAEHKLYKVDERGILEFIKAHQHSPLELKNKFIFVFEAEKVPPTISNKWLKTLEEPKKNVSTILLIDGDKPLMSTIESRAITLRLKGEKKIPLSDGKSVSHFHQYVLSFLDKLDKNLERKDAGVFSLTKDQRSNLEIAAENQDLYAYSEIVKSSKSFEEFFFNLTLEYASSIENDFLKCQELLDVVKWYQTSLEYNNSSTSRIFSFIKTVSS